MKDENRTKKQLIDELVEMRKRIKQLEKKTTKPARKSNHKLNSDGIYRVIFENMAVPVIIIDDDMTICKINPEAEKLSGYLRQEAEGKMKWTELIPQNEVERMKEYHRLRSVEPDVAPRCYESQFFDKEGKIKDIFIMIDMLSDGRKRVASVLDITERKQAVEALRRSEESLKEKVKQFERLFDTDV